MFNQYPYLNINDLNLDYILNQIKIMMNEVTNFVSINAIKYADPIQWNITSQYEKNTIVIDPVTGTAYISVAPVPVGIALTRTDYWTVVFDLEQFVTKANGNFTVRVEEQTTLTATFPTPLNGWVVWGGVLYRANTNILAGDQYVIGSNISKITVEEIIGHIDDLNTTDKSNLVAAINEVITILTTTTGNLDNLTTTDKSNLVAAINEVITILTTTMGDLDNLTTIDKSNLVAAINEVLTNLNNTAGDLSTLETPIKTSLVDAINSQRIAHYLDGIRLYVDGVNGDDNNDGSDSTHAFKTMDRFFSIANKVANGSSDIRCIILTAGIYDVGQLGEHVFNALSIHITGDVAGIILNFLSGENIRFYACHLNLENITVRTSDPTITFGIDGSSFYIKNCIFDCKLYLYAATGYMETSQFPSLLSEHSLFRIINFVVTNTDPTVDALYFRDSHVCIGGDGNNYELVSAGVNNSYITGVDSVLDITADPANITNQYYYGLSLYRCILRTSRRRYNRFTERSQNGVYNQGSSVFVANKTDNDPSTKLEIWYNTFQHDESEPISVTAGNKTVESITFPVAFESVPTVIACLSSHGDPGGTDNITVEVSSVTTTGFNVTLFNNGADDKSRRINWFATTF